MTKQVEWRKASRRIQRSLKIRWWCLKRWMASRWEQWRLNRSWGEWSWSLRFRWSWSNRHNCSSLPDEFIQQLIIWPVFATATTRLTLPIFFRFEPQFQIAPFLAAYGGCKVDHGFCSVHVLGNYTPHFKFPQYIIAKFLTVQTVAVDQEKNVVVIPL